MRTIRRGVFETNSSSTHSITMVSSEDYDKWENGELLLSDDDELVTIEEAIEELKKHCEDIDLNNNDEVNNKLRNWGYQTYDEYYDNDYLEFFSNRFTTKNGDKIVAFGKYGYDG